MMISVERPSPYTARRFGYYFGEAIQRVVQVQLAQGFLLELARHPGPEQAL